MPEYVYSIVLVLAIVGIMVWWVAKKKSEEWEGILIKKKHIRGDMETSDTYTLIFKTDDGKKKRFSNSNSKMFDEWVEGERAIKKKGEFFPSKE